MKSKLTTYILVAGVVLVWGMILWRIFAPQKDGPAVETPTSGAAAPASSDQALLLNYRDPFLGAPQPKPVVKPTAAVAVPPAVEPQNHVHRVHYVGRISRDGVCYGLIRIDDTLHTMMIGETLGGYRLKSICPDSVQMMWKNQPYTARLGE